MKKNEKTTGNQFKIILRGYQFFRTARYNFLYSAFGYVSHCRHRPACGTYLLRKIQKEGLLLGGAKGILRVLRCW